jgi:uncharacterized protein (DUF305 family)
MNGNDMGGHGMAAGSAPATGHNAQDVMFTQMMIRHHQQAIAMAEQARGSSADAKAMANNIVTSQSAEITTMRKLLA